MMTEIFQALAIAAQAIAGLVLLGMVAALVEMALRHSPAEPPLYERDERLHW